MLIDATRTRFTRRGLAALVGAAAITVLAPAAGLGAGSKTPAAGKVDLWFGDVSVPRTATAALPAVRKSAPAEPLTADVMARYRWWSVGGPAYRWNEVILDEMQEAFVVLPMAARNLALFHAALDDAVATARRHRLPQSGRAQTAVASEYAAAAEAAAAVLSHLFPARGSAFAQMAEASIALRVAVAREPAAAVADGRAIGQAVAAAAIARAKADGSDAKWSGAVPAGPGRWTGTNPIAPLAGTWRTWVLTKPDEFRPPAPPTVDSAEVKAALAELKGFTRTPRTNHRSVYWEVHGGARAHTLWNEIARSKLLEYGSGEKDGAHVLATLNVALADAGTACWDAKFAYWYIRPPQLDPDLKSLFPPPNHPSYPAAHGCYSTAAATVLANVFPRDRERLLALGKEAAEARVWAGIHYRFDIEAGQELGRKVAQKVLDRTRPGESR